MDKGLSGRPDSCKGHNIDSLYAYFERWLLSVEELNRERFSALEKQTALIFTSNKEAVGKAEDAQKAYNMQHNDLTRKMEVQAAQFVGRERFDDTVKQFDLRIADIKAVLDGINAAGGARREVVQEQRRTTQWTISQAIAVAFGLSGFAVAVFEFLRQSAKP